MGKAQTSAFQNRELSWLQFNRRVQAEADQPKNPLLERAKFLAIVTSNLDEFMQVRYPKVFRAAKGKKAEKKQLGGLTSKELYQKVNKEILSQNNQQYLLFDGISSELYLHGIRLYPVFSLSHTQSDREKELFHDSILPFLKELPQDAAVSQKQLHLCVKLTRSRGRRSRFALVALPAPLPRIYALSETRDDQCLIGLEDVVRHHVNALFPRETVEHCGMFRILRNQNFELPECTPEGMEGAVREMLGMGRSGQVMRLEAEERMSEEMLTWLMKRLDVQREQRYRVTGPLDLNKLMMAVYGMVKRPELKYTPMPPKAVPELMGDDIFDRIEEKDYLLFHPYHSFDPVVHLVERAAEDPSVRTIQQTLYRVSGNSPIVAALAHAAENGKQVYVLFESQARFDEENNIQWATKLEKAGCHVIYGLTGLKTHCKICLVVRKDKDGIRRYLHMGTGNYNDSTARFYTDIGMFTCREEYGVDASSLFNVLTGYSTPPEYNKFIVAPHGMRPFFEAMIIQETENAKLGLPAKITAKVNSLVDPEIISLLYDASNAGVKIDLIVRGICCLVPGVHGLGQIRLREHQILRDVAQLRVGEELDLLLLFLPVHHQIRGGQQGLGQKIGEIFAEMAVDPARRQLLAEIFVGGNVLHREGRHGLIVMIDLRNEFRSQPGLQHQGLRLDLVAVEIQRAAGGAQQLVRLLHDDGAAVPPGAHLKDIVDVAVADLNAIGFLLRLEKMEHFHGVPLHILRLH